MSLIADDDDDDDNHNTSVGVDDDDDDDETGTHFSCKESNMPRSVWLLLSSFHFYSTNSPALKSGLVYPLSENRPCLVEKKAVPCLVDLLH